MKYFIMFGAVLLIMASAALAEEETLIGSDIEHGGFGGPVIKFTEMNDEFAVLVGGRGGWIINHSFVIGGGGYGLVTQDIDERVITPDTTIFMTMGYGGLDLEYIASPNDLIHLTISSLIGAGGIDYSMKSRFNDHDMAEYASNDADAFFVFEPGVNAELNVVKFLRADLGISYRYINGIETEGLSDSDLSGIAAGITLKFGKF